jgi:predicted HD superfamily hydrolase involved in NAD metabolism
MCVEELKERIKHDLKRTLSKRRYKHILGVAEAAVRLARRYGADVDKAELAGLLHDSAKEMPLDTMRELARKSFQDTLPEAILSVGNLLHGYAAVTIVRDTYGINDTDIWNAVAHHTTGAKHMSVLEKIIFLADYIEVNRDFQGVERLREAAGTDLDQAVLLGFDSTIGHLLEQGKMIYLGTVDFRNYLIAEMQSDCDRR